MLDVRHSYNRLHPQKAQVVARSIAADKFEAWRAVIVFKTPEGVLEYVYEGIYTKRGTAMGRCTFWANWQDNRDDLGIGQGQKRFYDGWVEKADITWNKVKD